MGKIQNLKLCHGCPGRTKLGISIVAPVLIVRVGHPMPTPWMFGVLYRADMTQKKCRVPTMTEKCHRRRGSQNHSRWIEEIYIFIIYFNFFIIIYLHYLHTFGLDISSHQKWTETKSKGEQRKLQSLLRGTVWGRKLLQSLVTWLILLHLHV